ncbi:MAG: hypothetical protein Q9188_006504 [Gyalolechia gomerana]
MHFCSHVIPAAVEGLYTGIKHPSNITCRNWEVAAELQTENNINNADLKMLFLHFFLPMIVVAMAINLWLGFVRPWEYHRDDARNTTGQEYYEDWLLLDSEIESESHLSATRYNSVKKSPLSPDEVDRLACLIRADDEIPRSSGRKRKATGQDSPVSDASTNGWSVSPRTRKLKIVTDFAMDQRIPGGENILSRFELRILVGPSDFRQDVETPVDAD